MHHNTGEYGKTTLGQVTVRLGMVLNFSPNLTFAVFIVKKPYTNHQPSSKINYNIHHLTAQHIHKNMIIHSTQKTTATSSIEVDFAHIVAFS